MICMYCLCTALSAVDAKRRWSVDAETHRLGNGENGVRRRPCILPTSLTPHVQKTLVDVGRCRLIKTLHPTCDYFYATMADWWSCIRDRIAHTLCRHSISLHLFSRLHTRSPVTEIWCTIWRVCFINTRQPILAAWSGRPAASSIIPIFGFPIANLTFIPPFDFQLGGTMPARNEPQRRWDQTRNN